MTAAPRLAAFVAAQDPVYAEVMQELSAGRKETHWMWFIFPQLAELGRSAAAKRFGLATKAEARAYWEHPVLGPRLRECVQALLAQPNGDIGDVMGYPDDLKLRSCLTLFALAVPEEPVFEAALARFFGAEKDPLTLQLLGRE